MDQKVSQLTEATYIYQDDAFLITQSGVSKQIKNSVLRVPTTIYANPNLSATDGTSETILISVPILANTMQSTGSGIRFTALLSLSASAGTKTITTRYGALGTTSDASVIGFSSTGTSAVRLLEGEILRASSTSIKGWASFNGTGATTYNSVSVSGLVHSSDTYLTITSSSTVANSVTLLHLTIQKI